MNKKQQPQRPRQNPLKPRNPDPYDNETDALDAGDDERIIGNERGYLYGPGSVPPPHAPEVVRSITQQELQLIVALQAQTRRLSKLRSNIVTRLAEGAVVEPGPLEASVKSKSEQRLSWSRVAQVLGNREVEKLRKQLPPTISRYLQVHEQRGAKRPPPSLMEGPIPGSPRL